MTLRKLPRIDAFDALSALNWDPPAATLSRWNAALRAAGEDDDNVITILDVIGEDFWTGGGVTAKRINAALRKIGARAVTVLINSPGGDFFEGIAILNMLLEHPQKVTVKVLGLAASAASVIAMAGDEILVAKTGFLMVHNAWGLVLGDRHDMRKIAEDMESFDGAMSGLFADRAGVKTETAAKWMDDETWFNGAEAIEAGLADGLLPSSEIGEGAAAQAAQLTALRQVDNALARQGVSRGERRKLLASIKGGTPGAAAENATPRAGDEIAAGLRRLIETLKP